MEEKIFEISAKEVTIEVVDEATGKTYRRTLPIDYYETANGLVLRGENLDGSMRHFITAIEKGQATKDTAMLTKHVRVILAVKCAIENKETDWIKI